MSETFLTIGVGDFTFLMQWNPHNSYRYRQNKTVRIMENTNKPGYNTFVLTHCTETYGLNKGPNYPKTEKPEFTVLLCVCSGTMEPAEVREIFRDGLFEIQIHDRDRKKMKQEKPAALFGEEPDDDKISSIALVASKGITLALYTVVFSM